MENSREAGTRVTFNLRHAFVAMLFALVAGQIAQSCGVLVAIYGMEQRAGVNALKDAAFWVPVAHLAVTLSILTASWVGWSVTALRTNGKQLKSVFHWPYILLILDVLLVINYFIIATSVELDHVFKASQDSTSRFVKVAVLGNSTAVVETFWIMVMFVIYWIWDVVHDVFTEYDPDSIYKSLKRALGGILEFASNVIVHSLSSMIALIIVALGWYYLSNMATPASELQVIACDIMLIGIVFLFRVFKNLEYPLARLLSPSIKVEKRPISIWSWLFSGGLFALGFVIFVWNNVPVES